MESGLQAHDMDQSDTPARSADRAGELVATRYRLDRHLATGGMSEVWLAWDTATASAVALKFLSTSLSARQGFVALLKAEAAKLERLHHPHIVRLHASGEDRGNFFIALDYLPGDSLLKFRGAHWRKVLELILPIAAALEYAHSRGIVHRDLKPGNVLLDAHEVPHLSDFGVAGLLGLSPESQPRGGGSLPAMSPQQLDGAPVAIADDVYGFGTMLYDLITGAPLFGADPTPERVRSEVPPRLSATALAGPVPAALDELVAAALSKQPAQRPGDMGAMLTCLGSLRGAD
jgi:serine/threonine-protein kinase